MKRLWLDDSKVDVLEHLCSESHSLLMPERRVSHAAVRSATLVFTRTRGHFVRQRAGAGQGDRGLLSLSPSSCTRRAPEEANPLCAAWHRLPTKPQERFWFTPGKLESEILYFTDFKGCLSNKPT